MLRAVFNGFVDFLYPKSPDVYNLESLAPADLLRILPASADLGDHTLALFSYTDPKVRDLIWELKYRKNLKIAVNLALVLYDVLKTELVERSLSENFKDPLLIPVPMSEKKLLARGWNQTELLSEEIKKLDTENFLRYLPRALTKSHTESQTLTKNKKERLRNVEGTMSVEDPSQIRGRNIILLDDVTTTGATFTEARRVLKSAGAKKILCVALAH